MGILDDIMTAVVDYPSEYLEIEVYDVDPPGNGVDVNEDVTFRIRVSNSGLLHVDDLQFLVEGLNGTEVKGNGAGAQWVSSWTTSTGWFPRVSAHSDRSGPVEMTGGDFHFRPTRTSTTVKDLVRVSVAGWASSGFDHLFANHTEADPQSVATYSSTVSTD